MEDSTSYAFGIHSRRTRSSVKCNDRWTFSGMPCPATSCPKLMKLFTSLRGIAIAKRRRRFC